LKNTNVLLKRYLKYSELFRCFSLLRVYLFFSNKDVSILCSWVIINMQLSDFGGDEKFRILLLFLSQPTPNVVLLAFTQPTRDDVCHELFHWQDLRVNPLVSNRIFYEYIYNATDLISDLISIDQPTIATLRVVSLVFNQFTCDNDRFASF